MIQYFLHIIARRYISPFSPQTANLLLLMDVSVQTFGSFLLLKLQHKLLLLYRFIKWVYRERCQLSKKSRFSIGSSFK